MNHAKSMAVVVAYDMYLECAEGKLDPDWKVSNPHDFWSFREQLSELMLQYSPTNCNYPGDKLMRKATQQSRVQRRVTRASARGRPRSRTPSPTLESVTRRRRTGASPQERHKEVVAENNNPITREMLDEASLGPTSRLCGNLEKIMCHVQSITGSKKHGRKCAVCGKEAYTSCGLCNIGLHYNAKQGVGCGKMCFFDYHDDQFFGLACADCTLVGTKLSEFNEPTAAERRAQAFAISILQQSGEEENEATVNASIEE